MEIEIDIIAAYGHNLVIGNNGTLPAWKLFADMKHFKETTMGYAIIMGRKTYESFARNGEPPRPLPGRDNFIVTRNAHYVPTLTNDRTFVCSSLLGAIRRASNRGVTKVFIIGGGEIYKESLEQKNFIDKVLVTRIEGTFEGDTYFPYLDPLEWNTTVLQKVKKDEKNSHDFSIIEYAKK